MMKQSKDFSEHDNLVQKIIFTKQHLIKARTNYKKYICGVEFKV